MKHLSKAETLQYLNSVKFKNKFYIPKFIYYNKKFVINNIDILVEQISKEFKTTKIIIRSSSFNEDSINFTNAGKYNSFVCSRRNLKEIKKKINILLSKFKKNNDQIIFQEFISDVSYAGVCFTKDINSKGPYYSLSIDYSGKTNVITSGTNSNKIKNYFIYKFNNKYFKNFKRLINVFQELEKLYELECLDIEFAVKKKIIYIFQCRIIPNKKGYLNKTIFNNKLKKIEEKIKINKFKKKKLFGPFTIFSKMSDWNPVEILGDKASVLSLSLYSTLITDEVWAMQRNNYGYEKVLKNKLMYDFCNTPFIDLRTDLNSFLLASFPKRIKKKLIFDQLNKIYNQPNLHDKIEFEVVKSCYDFSNKNITDNLNNDDQKIIKNELIHFTNNIINNKYLDKDISKIKLLTTNFNIIKKKNLIEINKINLLINECKKNGTLPFAGIARCAFISTIIFNSLLSKKLINQFEHDNFFNSIKTISNQINLDFKKLKISKINKNYFLKIYGHLRPSSYSITSKNYKEGFSKYFNLSSNIIKNKSNSFSLSHYKIKKINLFFKKNNIKFNFETFLNFAQESIINREKSKFEFTKYINEIFINMINYGKKYNIPRQDLEYIDIKKINYLFKPSNIQKLKDIIRKNKEENLIANQILFPDLIIDPKDIYFFEQKNQIGNFVTLGQAIGKIAYIDTSKKINNINNRIVLIDNADPGYDFLFSYNILGLITKYGGPNSHMAVRCNEWGIPSIIGVGEYIFNQIKLKNTIYIDCKTKIYKVIK